MANYELAEAAEADLRSIALYTISRWGSKQAARYGAILHAHFEAIGTGKPGRAASFHTDPNCAYHASTTITYSTSTGKSNARSSLRCSMKAWTS